jgi:hypothetical protein
MLAGNVPTRFRHAPTCFLVACILAVGTIGCSSMQSTPFHTDSSKRETYEVQRVAEPVTIDANWDKAVWRNIEPIEINRHMGAKPEHRPRTHAKVVYDDENLYVIFRVEDRYVRAVAQENQGRVWEDSCVEFFFTPGPDRAIGYMNLEMNCGGTFLFHAHATEPRGDDVTDEDCARLEVARTVPTKLVEPEIDEPLTWSVEYRLPIDVIAKQFDITRPAPGVVWRANFYKCGDKTSHPHWLTWSIIDGPKLGFHQPEFFGVLVFR